MAVRGATESLPLAKLGRLPRASRGLRPQDRSPPADHRPQTGPCPACAAPTPPLGNAAQPQTHSPIRRRTPLSQIPGVDLTQIDGMGMQTTEVLRAEVGADMSKGENGKTFCFLVGAQSRQSDPRWQGDQAWHQAGSQPTATAVRLAAQSLFRSKSALGAKFRRLRTRLGAPQATTAMANPLPNSLIAC
jgi:hypothetical protein